MRKLKSGFVICALLFGIRTSVTAQTPATPGSESQKPAQTEKRSSSSTQIKGRIIAEGGRPVADATVMIFPVNIASNVQGAITSLLRPISSDADGKFEITSLRPGAYSLSASSPGYVSSDPDSKVFYRPGDNATITLVKGGVITGRVTNSSGEPVIAALVRAIKIRDASNKPIRMRSDISAQFNNGLEMMLGPFKTDDRGVYRIYGLSPGYYQVAAGGRSGEGFSFGGGNAYDGDAPTYFPSSTIETASEVTVNAGEESSGIDIRYRENRGHSIGGTVTVSAGPQPQNLTVLLTRASNGIVEATTMAMTGRDHFGFDNVLDGEYFVTAMGTSGNLAIAAGTESITASISQPRRVTVRGADVSGISLVIEPLGSIAGRIAVEALRDAKEKALCKNLRPAPIEGAVLSTQDDRKDIVDAVRGPLAAFKETTPDEKSEFIISFLQAGTHRLNVQLPSPDLYLKAVTLQPSEPGTKPVDVAKSGVKLKPGEKIKGLIVTASEGAARLSGRVVIGSDNKPPETRMRMHLIPAEPEAAEDVLRYYEAEVSIEGAFSLANLQPGKYWLVARETSDSDNSESDRKPSALDPGARTALRFEGEASKSIIELTECQLISDHLLKYSPLTKPSKTEKKPVK